MSAIPLAQRVSALRELLGDVQAEFHHPVLTTSFGAEDMVLFDLIARDFRRIAVATIDTGRLPVETYQFWQQVVERYRTKVAAYVPQAEAVQTYVSLHGINGFYDSLAERQECCHIRKVEPLARLLDGHDAWLTGLRRGQSQARATLAARAFDEGTGIVKINPLVDWSEAEVWHYLRHYEVPVHPLHAQGYPSIGCAPCTRAIAPGEDVRAGRWWWELAGQKECGLHVAEAVKT